MCNRKRGERLSARFCFEWSQKWDRAQAPFLGPFFPKIKFFGGLVFGAAWRSLFWSRSQLSVFLLADAAGMSETSSGLHLLGLHGAALWLRAYQPVGNIRLSGGVWTSGFFRHC